MITFDTGALIALDRRDRRVVAFLQEAIRGKLRITAPTCVIGEWWHGQRASIARILDGIIAEPLTLPLAKTAGEAMALVRGATLVDCVVVASAAQRGDLVLTSDLDDLARIRDAAFRSVRLRGV